jgi:hypothetical protein
VIIGTSGDDASQTEWGTIWAIRYVPSPTGGQDTEISILNPLVHRHIGVTERHGSHTLEMRAEVGL